MRFASATATTFTGFLSSMRQSQSVPGFPHRLALICAVTPKACLRHDAPRYSSRRRYRLPAFEIRPNRSLPPLECGCGVSPMRLADFDVGGVTGGAQAAVVVGDDEFDPAQPAGDEAFEEGPPMVLGLRQGHRYTQHPAALIRADAYGGDGVDAALPIRHRNVPSLPC